MRPYQCGRCDWWHLAPRQQAVHAALCQCISTNGSRKRMYANRGEAERTVQMLSPGGLATTFLAVYRCPEDPRGWHITGSE